jgi:thioredoxin:protein disulfide reductase
MRASDSTKRGFGLFNQKDIFAWRWQSVVSRVASVALLGLLTGLISFSAKAQDPAVGAGTQDAPAAALQQEPEDAAQKKKADGEAAESVAPDTPTQQKVAVAVAPGSKGEVVPFPHCPEIEEGTIEDNGDAESDDALEQKVENAVAEGNFVWALLLILLAGLLTALTPCVYPLIPITLSIFGARQTTAFKGFLLSSCYVGGMVVLYSSLGTAFAAFGFLAGSALQHPVVTVGVSLFCLAMAASMFGAFDLTLPASLNNRFNQIGGQGYRGAFLMGLVAGIIAAPCTGPVLSFILTLIAKDGDLFRGATMMVVYSLGIGLPFLVLGTFSTAIGRMPKSGPWMDTVKSLFGVMMLVAGLYYLQFGITEVGDALKWLGQQGYVWAVALTIAGIALGAFHLSFKGTSTAVVMRKGVGVAFTTFGLMGLIAYASSTPAPIKASSDDQVAAAAQLKWNKVGNEDGALKKFDAFLQKAGEACQPVQIDFYADWCTACKELDKFTYSKPEIQKESERFMNVKIDATDDTEDLAAIQKRYGVVGLPTIVFIDSRGRVKKRPKVTGFVEAEKYLPLMKKVR